MDRRIPARRPFATAVIVGTIVAGCLGWPGPDGGFVFPPPSDPAVEAPEPPPEAVLREPDGAEAPGEVGSYAFDGAGSDSPWLPAGALTSVDVERGSRLEIVVAGDLPIETWTVVAAAALDRDAERLVPVGEGSGPDASIVIDAPDVGAWVVQAQIGFGPIGSATYYWLLEVR